MKPAANAQAKPEPPKTEDARPTITLRNVMANGPDTAAFSGWGPRVNSLGAMLKNWN